MRNKDLSKSETYAPRSDKGWFTTLNGEERMVSVGVRLPRSIKERLDKIPSREKAALLRAAVEKILVEQGL